MKITINNIPIIGAVCGDILGSSYEWESVKNLDFPLCTGDDVFTDDTVCTIAVADAILNKKPMGETLQKWCRRYPYAGYGGSFRRWIRNENPQPYNSWGNGAAMRVSAAGALATSLEEALELAELSAEVTHNHPEGIKGAKAVAAAIYLAKEGSTKNEIKKYIEENFCYDLGRDYQEIQPGYSFDVSCMGSVPESIICFLEAPSYEDTIRYAIAMGGDADTMAAIAGSIAAAYYREIPKKILLHCEKRLPREMIDVVEQVANERRINVMTLSDGKQLECYLTDDIKTLPTGRNDEDGRLFYSNVPLFLKHSDEILDDSRMFFTPVYSQSFSPFFSRPTLGAFVEWWNKCTREPVERNGYPICYISGNPMTGSHACQSVTPDGKLMKANLCVSFIELLKSFGKINGRFRNLSAFYQSYSLKDVVDRLKKLDE